jgi:hypothetical protein
MRSLLIALAFIYFSLVSFDAVSQVNFSGYLKNYTVVQDEIDDGPIQLDRSYRMQNSGRFMLDVFNGNQVWQPPICNC